MTLEELEDFRNRTFLILEPGMKLTMPESNFTKTLQTIADKDVVVLTKKDAEYGSSWKKRGGVGAFMMLARKWDRLETRVNESDLDSKYDIFEAITNDTEKAQKPAESTLETIRDLRRYLLLVESEIVLRKAVDNYGSGPYGAIRPSPSVQEDPDRDYHYCEGTVLREEV